MTQVDPPWFHVVPSPFASVGVRPFVLSGELRLTVVVKLGLDLRHPLARVTEPPELVYADRYVHGRLAVESIVEASDLALRKKACDVTLTGFARTPAGQPAQSLPVRLGLFRGNLPMLRKAVVATGPVGQGGVIGAVSEVALTYENAMGGLDVPTNPVGSSSPCVHAPPDSPLPGCFGPVAAGWKVRRSKLDAPTRTALQANVPTLREPFEWEYFSSAPEDQRVPYLVGGEWLLIDGVSEMRPRVQTQLPALELEAVVVVRGGGSVVVPLLWDTLALEGELLAGRAVLRGDVASPLPIERSLEISVFVRRVAAASMAATAAPVSFPDPSILFAESNRVPAATPTRRASLEPQVGMARTHDLSASDHENASRSPVTPYGIGRPEPGRQAAAGPTPGAPWSPERTPAVTPVSRPKQPTIPLMMNDLMGGAPGPDRIGTPQGFVTPGSAGPQSYRPVKISASVGLPSYLAGQAPPSRASAPLRVGPALSGPAEPPAPPALAGPVNPNAAAQNAAAQKKRAEEARSRAELAAAALRKSGMSEEHLAEYLRELEREIGNET